MGFRSVYQSLTELFPQIDATILRGVAIEHQNNADEAASVVISEFCPPNFTQPLNKNRNKNKDKISDENPPLLKVERDLKIDDGSLSLSQWLQPSKRPHSYLALLNEEAALDVKPPLDYVVEKVVLPSRGAASGLGGGVRTVYSASDNIGSSSLVKPSIRVQSRANNELFASSSKVPVGRRSSRKSALPWSPDYSQKLRSWKKRSNNNNRGFSQLYGRDRDVPSKQSNRYNYSCYATERDRKQRIDDNIKALGELLPQKEKNPESTLDAIVDHVKLLQLQMKELSRSRLGGEPISHPMTFIEGYGHYIHHEQTKTKSLEEVMEDLLTNDYDAAASLFESKGLYLMPLSAVQGSSC